MTPLLKTVAREVLRKSEGWRRRFRKDAVPVLMLLLGWAYRDRSSPWLAAAVALGIAVHAYGIFVINVLGLVQ